MKPAHFPHDFFSRTAPEVAAGLIGATLTVDGVGGKIVETEAYDHEDPASHSFAGPTVRNLVMFGPSARVYVYRSYGLHWCVNLVCDKDGHGAAVLIRALEPLTGLEAMQQRRGMEDLKLLCAGPGRVAQALGINSAHNGLRLDAPPFAFHLPEGEQDVIAGPRIGISKAVEVPWRFGLRGSRFLSKRFK